MTWQDIMSYCFQEQGRFGGRGEIRFTPFPDMRTNALFRYVAVTTCNTLRLYRKPLKKPCKDFDEFAKKVLENSMGNFLETVQTHEQNAEQYTHPNCKIPKGHELSPSQKLTWSASGDMSHLICYQVDILSLVLDGWRVSKNLQGLWYTRDPVPGGYWKKIFPGYPQCT